MAAGAYDADGHLLGTADVLDDGTLSEPLHVPAGGHLLILIPGERPALSYTASTHLTVRRFRRTT